MSQWPGGRADRGRSLAASDPHRRLRWALLGAALVTVVGGCNREIVPVTGRVTLDGQPLASAVVIFQPIREPSDEPPAATGSVGRTDAAGRYALRLVDPDRPGALVGAHTVVISTAQGPAADGELPRDERVPEKWRDGSQRYTVPARGAADADFAIQTAPLRTRPPRGKSKKPG